MRVDYKGMQLHGSASEIVAFLRLYDEQPKEPQTTQPWKPQPWPTPWDIPPKSPFVPGIYVKTTTGDVPNTTGKGELTYEPLPWTP